MCHNGAIAVSLVVQGLERESGSLHELKPRTGI